MKIDPHNHERKYKNWKKDKLDEEGNVIGQIKGIRKENSDILLRYISDMERGVNIAA